MPSKDNVALTVFVMQLYVNEPCRICGQRIEEEDLRDLVFAGYSKGNLSRAAHGECWKSGLPKHRWAYSEDDAGHGPIEQPKPEQGGLWRE